MVLHSFFTGRIDRLAIRLDEVCQQVIDAISEESLTEAKAIGESRRRAAG
jgi:hypothetical protein